MSKKRGNNEGSIYRTKQGLWRGAYFVYTAEGPKRRYVSGKTRQEVATKLTRAMADRDAGLATDAGTLTLGDFLDHWLLTAVKGTVRQTTWERYEQIVRVHIRPTLGGSRLKALGPAHVRSLYQEKLAAGLSPRTVQYVHVTLHKALRQAVSDGLLPRAVTAAVKAPQPTGKEIHPLSPEQAKALLSAARGDKLEALIVLAVSTGMREGELLGLQWGDLDLGASTLSVRRTLTMTKDGPVFNAPKSAKSRRSIRLTAAAVEALRVHKIAQNEARLRLGSLWEDRDLVFPGEAGQPMRPWSLTGGPYQRLLRKAGLPEKTRFHDLRHTFATLMLRNAEHPRVVQEMLGHATIGITMDTYSHVLPNMQREAMERLGALLT